MKLRQPIIRVRREGGRVTCAPEFPPVVLLIRRPGLMLPCGGMVTAVHLCGVGLKLRP